MYFILCILYTMYLSLYPLNKETIDLAEQSFPAEYINQLKTSSSNYHGSLIGRYIVSKHIHQETWVWYNIATWVYQQDKFYFSYAHTDEYVLVAIEERKIWVDLEIIKSRDTSLLHQYHSELEHMDKVTWESFYAMRTAKEALIKFLDLSFNEIESIELVGVSEFDIHYGDIHFSKTLSLIYHGEKYAVFHGEKDQLSYAVTMW